MTPTKIQSMGKPSSGTKGIDQEIGLNKKKIKTFIKPPPRPQAFQSRDQRHAAEAVRKLLLEEPQKRYIRHIPQKTKGRVCGPNGAERILGMKRSALYLKLRQYGMHTRNFLQPKKADNPLFFE